MISSFVAQLNISLLPTLVLLLICRDMHKDHAQDSSSRAFLLLVITLAVLLVLEPITWLHDGDPSGRYVPLAWASNMAFFIVSAFFPCLWFIYTLRKLTMRHVWKRRHRWSDLLFSLPAVLFCIVLLVIPGERGVFYINEQHAYERGALFLLPYAINFLYLAMSAGVSVYIAIKGPSVEVRRHARFLAFALLLPLLGMLLQSLTYGWWVARPISALSILMLYISIQRQTVSNDSLTGLNNRKQMASYLTKKWRLSEPDASWCLIMIDIDHFKQINDRCGHTVGDEALCLMAELLKRAFSNASAFLCRYGGDEFVVILNCASPADAERYIAALRTLTERENESGAHPYVLSFSEGHAFYDPALQSTEAVLLAHADLRMYHSKRQRA